MSATALSAAVLVALTVASLSRTVRTRAAAAWLTRTPRRGAGTPVEPFVLLLPAFREQTLVRRTLAHFRDLDYPSELYRVVVITSERERDDRERLRGTLADYAERLWNAGHTGGPVLTGHLAGDAVAELLDRRPHLTREEFLTAVRTAFEQQPTTGALVAEAARGTGASAVHLVEAPRDRLGKAGQLQYALDELDRVLADWPELDRCSYVMINDFDARPVRGALSAAAVAAGAGAPILQQAALAAPMSAAHREVGWFALLDGQLHARWGLRAELAALLLDRRLARLPAGLDVVLRSSVHTVGNGLFLHRRGLVELGGLPEVVDDLALGWRAAAAGLPCEPVDSVVWYDAYHSREQASASRRFICRGHLDAFAELRKTPTATSFSRGLQLLKIHTRLAHWAVGPFARSGALALCALVLPWWTAVAVVVSYALLVVDMTVVHRLWRWGGFLTGVPRSKRLAAIVLGPVALLWFGAGARAHLLARALGRAAAPKKTER